MNGTHQDGECMTCSAGPSDPLEASAQNDCVFKEEAHWLTDTLVHMSVLLPWQKIATYRDGRWETVYILGFSPTAVGNE